MASSMIWQTRSGTIALTALTHTRASALPMTSIALAARSTIRRIASISMRALAITSVFLPRRASGLPNASRLRPRRTISSSAFSAAPIERMQWWMRPGPRRTWEISKPRPSPSSMFAVGHADVVEAQVHVAVRGVVLAEHVHRPEDLDARRVHRHEDLRLALVRRPVGAGLHHDDHDLAARVAGAGDVVLLAVDHPLVAVEHGPAARCSWRPTRRRRARSWRTPSGSRRRAAARATASSARACRPARAPPCCRCRARCS